MNTSWTLLFCIYTNVCTVSMCSCFRNCSEIYRHLLKNKCGYKTWNTKDIIDVKVQMWLKNEKYVGLSLNTSWVLVICTYTHVCTILKDIGIKKEKEICVQNKESTSCHRCERTNMTAKCEMFMNFDEKLIGICQTKYDCQTRNS